MLKYNVSSSTGTFDAVAAASQVSGSSIFIGGICAKVAGLSALVVVDAETSTITLAAKWQVSNDNSTFVDVSNGSQNAAAVVLATGTGGADASVTKMIPAPDAVYGWKYARIAIVVGVTTGAVGDTYTMGYCYRQLTGSER